MKRTPSYMLRILEKRLNGLRSSFRRLMLRRNRDCINLGKNLEDALRVCIDDIPVFVVSFNNGVYVRNMVQQLQKLGITPIVIDNCSTNKNSLIILNELKMAGSAQIVFSGKNFGHLVGFLEPIYPLLPEVFAYTDPDLQFHPQLPRDFLFTLAQLTTTFQVYKAGFALQLPENQIMIDKTSKQTTFWPVLYEREFSVREWELRFWRKPLAHPNLEVWAADIDTTFAVYRKANYLGDFFDAVRVSGNYGAIHLPWFPKLDLFSEQERNAYHQGNVSSTWN